MTDVIKFKCKACEKKISVRAQYAGKQAKCPGCQQALRVPSPRPKRSATGVPVAAGASQDVGSASHSGSAISLADLVAMEEQAPVELTDLSVRGGGRNKAIRIEGGKDCPECNASCKPDAVLCIDCGHNFESGKRLKTKHKSSWIKRLIR